MQTNRRPSVGSEFDADQKYVCIEGDQSNDITKQGELLMIVLYFYIKLRYN